MADRSAPDNQGSSAAAGQAWPPKIRIQLDTDVLGEAAKQRVAKVLEQTLQEELAKTPSAQRVSPGRPRELVFGYVPPPPRSPTA